MKKASVSGGTAILNFASKAHLDEAKEALSLKYKVSSKSEDRKKLDPKLTIRDIPTDIISKETLEEKLLEKNENMKSIKVVFFDDKQRYAVIQVSAETRESIRRNGDCVNIDLSEHYVTDRFHVIQCYHCQEFGHMANSRYCKDKDKDPTCFYCGGSHTSRDCMNKKDNKIKKMKCSNCCKSRNPSEKNSAATHKASDNLCPSFVRERAAIMSRTAGCEQAKNSYIQRIKEAKARLGRV